MSHGHVNHLREITCPVYGERLAIAAKDSATHGYSLSVVVGPTGRPIDFQDRTPPLNAPHGFEIVCVNDGTRIPLELGEDVEFQIDSEQLVPRPVYITKWDDWRTGRLPL